jgi:hypothetical protein
MTKSVIQLIFKSYDLSKEQHRIGYVRATQPWNDEVISDSGHLDGDILTLYPKSIVNHAIPADEFDAVALEDRSTSPDAPRRACHFLRFGHDWRPSEFITFALKAIGHELQLELRDTMPRTVPRRSSYIVATLRLNEPVLVNVNSKSDGGLPDKSI